MRKKKMQKQNNSPSLFSGDGSRDMWKTIADAKTKKQLRNALYYVCCKVQVLEYRMEHLLP